MREFRPRPRRPWRTTVDRGEGEVLRWSRSRGEGDEVRERSGRLLYSRGEARENSGALWLHDKGDGRGCRSWTSSTTAKRRRNRRGAEHRAMQRLTGKLHDTAMHQDDEGTDENMGGNTPERAIWHVCSVITACTQLWPVLWTMKQCLGDRSFYHECQGRNKEGQGQRRDLGLGPN